MPEPPTTPPEDPLHAPLPVIVKKKAIQVRIFGWLLRLGSVSAGVAVEYHEVYTAASAQWALVFLGLWLMGVPPALWFDGLRRISQIAQFATEAAHAADTKKESERP
jgi:hypothetical protein